MNLIQTALVVPLATDAELCRANVQGLEQIGIEVKNTGANPFDNFDVYVQFADGGSEILMASVAGDYTTPNFPVIKASGDLNILAAGAIGWLVLNVRPFNNPPTPDAEITGGVAAVGMPMMLTLNKVAGNERLPRAFTAIT